VKKRLPRGKPNGRTPQKQIPGCKTLPSTEPLLPIKEEKGKKENDLEAERLRSEKTNQVWDRPVPGEGGQGRCPGIRKVEP